MKKIAAYALAFLLVLSLGACKKSTTTVDPGPTVLVKYTLTTTAITISNFSLTGKDSSGAYVNKLVLTAPDKSVLAFNFIGTNATTYDLSVAGSCYYIDVNGKVFAPYNGQLTLDSYVINGTKRTINGTFSFQGKASDNTKVNINNGQLTNVSTK